MEKYDIEKLIGKSPAELTDMGVCPTCFNKQSGGALYGDESLLDVYSDSDIEIKFVPNPREKGHMMIASASHYHDMSEAPDELNAKIIRFAKQLMKIIKEVYGCERVYICSMCDGPANHYHVQLIPRYPYEKRGSKNFVKPRQEYVYDKEKFEKVQKAIVKFAKTDKIL